ncbi:MAG: ATPase [Proteobacteria bacterium]|nr:ATPase [Pseudomonadota bacterium]
MRDIFSEILANEPIDPTAAVRRSMRPRLAKRFYEHVAVARDGNGFRVLLDQRPARTPARNVMLLPARELAEMITAEWQAQRDVIDFAAMPLTRLAARIIDGAADAGRAHAAEIGKYLACDLIFYRAQAPDALVARQKAHWDPILHWCLANYGARFTVAQGIGFAAQPRPALSVVLAQLPSDRWRLGAIHAATTLCGSTLIALALAEGELSPARAWAAAHVDDDWNMETWGRDASAIAARDVSHAEFLAAATILSLPLSFSDRSSSARPRLDGDDEKISATP